MSTLNHPELVALILAAVDRLMSLEKTQTLSADGVRLHPSEIHVLLFLHARPDASATEIARRFSVTKGAVSQTLSRLESKGVLTKERSVDRPGGLDIRFTERGRRVLPRVLALKDAVERRFDARLSSLTSADRGAVERFFRLMIEEEHAAP